MSCIHLRATHPSSGPEEDIHPKLLENLCTWNPKQPETNGCSNMAIEILYIGNGCLHPFLSGCLDLLGQNHPVTNSVLREKKKRRTNSARLFLRPAVVLPRYETYNGFLTDFDGRPE